ncbi:UDP-3-O-(3-hydroxymyristoyl)glucosamine N-acyltransferase [Moraxella sp. FZFQ2102]|uniref:UDP-3-O-(3-hydroxymyristoyl)glucosamine N-acyltransferase n=1 Tax=Moraxella sp. FZFQ2102 TaxID=2953752 RepID=UPI00209BCAE7|nr:UDP-3-O-(3-hydroxymyristoyl)glucosamine N-acyltransferase [Moraxella sp. FZFQ2102]USZ14497.1 UDP-3-O-(3-hydroxymyristoyl)glucosamine N-acyltransferase [Moraxella sp. FZFQ2102]
MVTLATIIDAIEHRQAVLNKDQLDLTHELTGVANLATANASQLAFLAQAKYLPELVGSQAGVVLISEKFATADEAMRTDAIKVVVKDAYLAYACASVLFAPSISPSIAPTAQIAASAMVGERVSIGHYAVIGEGAVIADGVSLGAHAVIADGAIIGADSMIASHVFIGHGCVLGARVRVHSHASIGSEGFGFAPAVSADGLQWQRITQLGRVIIGDDVRIGSSTCIDRGAVEDTVIGDHVIIDNLVQIAHNVRIGRGTAIAAKAGIAGSTTIGSNCIIGGAVGINGHLTIADGVTFTGMAMVIGDVTEAGTYSSGTVAMPQAKWRRAAVKFRQMGEK